MNVEPSAEADLVTRRLVQARDEIAGITPIIINNNIVSIGLRDIFTSVSDELSDIISIYGLGFNHKVLIIHLYDPKKLVISIATSFALYSFEFTRIFSVY